MSSWRATFAAFLLTAACAGPAPFQAGVRIREELYPGAVAADRGPHLVRLVDDVSGEPLAGAEVFHVAERVAPIAGEFWWTRRACSDAEGFVRLERPQGDRDWHLFVVRHARCGVAATSSRGERILRLGRGFDVPVRIVDWVGRPAAGAMVGFCGYCGHSPDLVSATADAAGVAVLRGVDVHQDIADLYVQHPGLHFFYDSIGWRPGDPPAVVRCRYGPAQHGRVLDHRGAPVAGALVCGGGKHRGPWARTAADGSFTILGAPAGESPHRVVVADRSIHFAAAVGAPVTLRLPDLADAEAYQGVAEPPPGLTSPPAARAVQVCRVIVEGAPGPVESSVWYPEAPEPRGADADDRVDVPVGAPFVLTVAMPGTRASRRFDFAEGAPSDGELRVRWWPDPVVRGCCVDADGVPCAAQVRWAHDDDEGVATGRDGRFELTPPAEGWFAVEVRATANAAWRRMHLRVGGPGSSDVDCGTVGVAGPAPLQLVDERGAALDAARVGFVRPGWHEPGAPEFAPLQPDGSWFGASLQAGDGIVVQRAGCVPFRTVLRGAGPWRLVVPAGQLDIEVVGVDGAACAATMVVGDHDDASEQGRFALRGLPLGPQRLWVSSPGHRSAVVDAVVTGSAQTLRVSLPTR